MSRHVDKYYLLKKYGFRKEKNIHKCVLVLRQTTHGQINTGHLDFKASRRSPLITAMFMDK